MSDTQAQVEMDEDKSSAECNDDMEDDAVDETQEDEESDDRPNVYLPGQPLKEGEELVCDQSAYIMIHQAQTGAPCLSFDIIKDNLGDNRQEYPLSCYIVSGTQASQTHANNVMVMKLSNLHRTKEEENDEDEEDEEDEEVDEAKTPLMKNAMIKHLGCVNRIRATTNNNIVLAASWSELGRVNIWNLTQQLHALDDPFELANYKKNESGNNIKPLFTFTGHQQEGFAMDWSSTVPGMLATGDCKRDIHIWKPAEGGLWHVDQRPLIGHTQSVEDLQWSPNEGNVLASCSVDKSIRIWDTRATPNKACMLTADKAHTKDVNVISWNKHEPFIVSGGDDGYLHVWDLRRFQNKSPVATFKHHIQPVTTVEWHPTEATVFASGGADNQIALWDLAVEKDDTEGTEDLEVPAQLLFVHQGQTDIKELHWHPQLPGVILSTAHSGFNIFRTISA